MREIGYSWAINEALREEMARDEDVFLIGLDVGLSGGAFSATANLQKEFGSKRVRDYPISESSLMNFAYGAALRGLRPVVELMFMDFLTICADPLINGVAKGRFLSGGQIKVPITIRAPIGVGAGADHSQSLEAWFIHIPGLKVVMASTIYDLKGLLKSAIRDDDPVLFIEHIGQLRVKESIPEDEYTIPLGKADIKREGKDVTVVATGRMISAALKAADQLATDGISVEVVDPRTLSPLDIETIINSVKKTGRLVTAHEAVKTGGIGGEIAAIVTEEAFDYLDAPIARVGAPFSPISMCPIHAEVYYPGPKEVVAAVRRLVG